MEKYSSNRNYSNLCPLRSSYWFSDRFWSHLYKSRHVMLSSIKSPKYIMISDLQLNSLSKTGHQRPTLWLYNPVKTLLKKSHTKVRKSCKIEREHTHTVAMSSVKIYQESLICLILPNFKTQYNFCLSCKLVNFFTLC